MMKKKIASFVIAGTLLGSLVALPITEASTVCDWGLPYKPAYCSQQNARVDWIEILTGLFSLTQRLKGNNIGSYYPYPLFFPEVASCCCVVSPCDCGGSGVSALTSSSLNNINSNSLLSQTVEQSTASRDETKQQSVSTQEKAQTEEILATTLSDKDSEASIRSSVINSEAQITSVVNNAISAGACNTPHDLSSLSSCLLSVASTEMSERDRLILFAAAAGDRDVKTLLALSANGLYNRYHSKIDDEDIQKVSALSKETDTIVKELKEKYADYETVLGDGAEALEALKNIKRDLVNGGLSDNSFNTIHTFMEKERAFLDSAKENIDPAFIEAVKAKRDAVVEGSESLQKMRNAHIKVDQKISNAGDKVLEKADQIEKKLGKTFLSESLKRVGENLTLLGSSNVGDKAEALLRMQQDIVSVAELAYAPNKQAETIETPKEEQSQKKSSTPLKVAAGLLAGATVLAGMAKTAPTILSFFRKS